MTTLPALPPYTPTALDERIDRELRRAVTERKAAKALGYPVLRFTGKELWRDPVAATEELCNFLIDDVLRQAKRGSNA